MIRMYIRKVSQVEYSFLKCVCILFILQIYFCCICEAQQLTLSWDAVEDADYYIIYYGEVSEVYTLESEHVAPGTTYTIENLADNQRYYFAVKAFNSCGNSSDYSDEVYDSTLPVDPDPDPVVEPLAGSVTTFEEVSLSTIVTTIDDYPSIEVFDSDLEHLDWLKTGWEEYNELYGVSHVAIGDINGNGRNEIIIGLTDTNTDNPLPGGFFEVVDNTYNHLAWGRVRWEAYNIVNGETWPVCGDIDGDGIDEVIIGLGENGNGYFEVFKFVNNAMVHMDWGQVRWPEYNSLGGETRPVCADIDNDAIDEIVVGLKTNAGNAQIPGGKFEVFDDDLSHLAWGDLAWPEYAEINGETWIAPGDIDGDGQTEIIAGLGAGGAGKLSVFEFENNVLTQSQWITLEWPEYNDVSGETRPVCLDVDNDSMDEIIVGLGPVTDNPDIPEGFFIVFDDDLTLMDWGQITNTVFNKINGESIPSRGLKKENGKIIMALGSWDAVVEDDTDSDVIIDDTSVTPASGGGGGGGCFLNLIGE